MKTIVDLTEELKKYSLEKDTAAKQAVEANIAPVEADASSASRAYVVGEQLFLNDVLYDVTSPISVGDAIVVNTNITIANKLSADIKSKIDDLYSKNQTLTSAFVNNVNENGCKNILPNDAYSQTLANVSVSVNDNGEITVSGTANNTFKLNIHSFEDFLNDFLELNKDYVFSSGIPYNETTANITLKIMQTSGGSWVFIRNGDTFKLTSTPYRIEVIWWASSGTVLSGTCKPMICLKSDYDLDPTYEPYTKTNRQLTEDSVSWSDEAQIGAVNSLDNKLSTQVDATSGLTVTVNADKSVIVSATSNTYPYIVPSTRVYVINSDSADNLENGKTYKFSGCPSGGGSSTYYMGFYQASVVDKSDKGDGYIFTKTASMTTVQTSIAFKSGCVLSDPLTFKPMITLASYNGDYVPYAKTNKELTDYADYIDSLTGYTVSDFNYKPTKAPFINYVGNASQWANPIADAGTNGGTLLWLGRLDTVVRLSQVFICNNGNIYTRLAKADDISGTWTYEPWHTITATS